MIEYNVSKHEYWDKFCNNNLPFVFDSAFYINKYEDISEFDNSAHSHFMFFGFDEFRSPSCYLDFDFILFTLYKVYNIEPNTVLEVSGNIINFFYAFEKHIDYINPFFSINYIKDRYNLHDYSVLDILSWYHSSQTVPLTNQEVIETCHDISWNDYLKENIDVALSNYTPVEHFIKYGVYEARAFFNPIYIDKKFLDGFSCLYRNKYSFSSRYELISSIKKNDSCFGPLGLAREVDNSSLNDKMDTPSEVKIAVGVVLYNNSTQELERLYESYLKQKNSALGFYVFCNDGNEDKYKNILGDAAVFIDNYDGNIGFGRAHNIMMNHVFINNFDAYLCINPDGFLLPKAIKSITEDYLEYDANSIVELATFPIEHPKWYDHKNRDTAWVSGAAFLFPKNIWERIGGFDENIHMYCEDVDLSWKAKANGFGLKVSRKAKFYHDISPRIYLNTESQKEKSREMIMLMGAYYLTVKWGGELLSKTLMDRILSLDPQAVLPSVAAVNLEQEVLDSVTDFENMLTFAPRRFL